MRKNDNQNTSNDEFKYVGLKYTPEGVNPKGRPRVYLCCHEKDFATYFEPICKEIRDIQANATIWYYDPAEGIPTDGVSTEGTPSDDISTEGLPSDGIQNEEEFLADLSQMNLFVIPVTSNFVYTENQARCVEFQFAIEHHIPILPLAQENGLEEDFSAICGNLQMLNRYNDDPTAIPYVEKLKKYLESVLVSDEMAQKIRAAFDAYIFLSYRKKDRKYAQQIMHLIHADEQCRDIAIWYDEFLTPGENFNDMIKAAMEKSQIFSMVVTPNLLENPNYVMTVEYPAAVELGKTIVPAEAVETDEGELANAYDGLPKVVKSEQIGAQLIDALKDVALGTNDNDSEHNFFIGLAYLSGIDVEVDNDRALKLITSAAEANLPEAYEKIVDMYSHGEGVKQDYPTAIEWQNKYVAYWENKYEKDQNETVLNRVLAEVYKLGVLNQELHAYGDAKNAYHKMKSYASRLGEDRSVVISSFKLGDVTQSEGDLDQAEAYYLEGLALCKKLAQTDDNIKIKQDLSVAYSRLGSILYKKGKLNQAKEYQIKGQEVCIDLLSRVDSAISKQGLMVSYIQIGDILKDEGKISEAKEYRQKGLELSIKLVEANGSISNRREMAVAYSRMADILILEKNYQKAKEYYLKCIDIHEELRKENNRPGNYMDLAFGYIYLGDCVREQGKIKLAKEYYLKSMQISEELLHNSTIIASIQSLAIVNDRLGTIYKSQKNMEKAKACFMKSCQLYAKLDKEHGSLVSKRGLMIACWRLQEIFEVEKDFMKAKAYSAKSVELSECLAKDCENVQWQWNIAMSQISYGNILKKEGNLKDAKGMYLRALELREGILDKYDIEKNPDDLMQMGMVYRYLGDILTTEGNLDETYDFYMKALRMIWRSVGRKLQLLFERIKKLLFSTKT